MSGPLSRRVPVRVDPERIERQLEGARARADRHVRVRRATRAAAAFAAIVVCIALFVRGARPNNGALEGTTVESVAGGDSLTMPDGSRIVLEAGSRATLTAARPDLVEWRIDRGGAEFDVSHVSGRRFVVAANGWQASVLGTRFVVRAATTAHGVEVQVERGRVGVGRAGEQPTRVLEAGETWSDRSPPPLPPSASTIDAAVSVQSEPAAGASDAASPTVAEPPAVPATVSTARRAAPERAFASELLERAEAARAASRPRDAAAALEELRSRYPLDPRAGLAAFELGRLRLDALGDPRGAVSAFSEAIRLAPSAPYREDAEARLVEALEAAGDRVRCEEARASFLERHPSSVHRTTVAARCRRH